MNVLPDHNRGCRLCTILSTSIIKALKCMRRDPDFTHSSNTESYGSIDVPLNNSQMPVNRARLLLTKDSRFSPMMTSLSIERRVRTEIAKGTRSSKVVFN